MVGRARWVLPIAALALVAWAADRIPPGLLLPIAVTWNIVLAIVIGTILRRLAKRITWTGAILATGCLAAAVFALSGVQWTGRAGLALPCRRNWGWLPSYLLRSSPTHSTRARVGGLSVKVCYGSPRSRGRKMVGSTRVPFGQLWRTGANEPTTVKADGPIAIAGVAVPSGLASLYTVPGPETWEVVINGSTGQWGIESEYPAAAEIGRRVLPSRTTGNWVEALAMRLEVVDSGPGGLAQLVIRWETSELRVPVQALAAPTR